MDRFDFIIVGAGSAGCVLANRLSASGQNRVLLLEAGGTDRLPWVRVPIGYGKTFHNRQVNWRFNSEPSAGLEGRPVYWPRGKVLGGSSSINGLVWMRGLPGDFDDWEEAGNPGWGWPDVAQVFDSIEALGDGTTTGPDRISVADRRAEYHSIGAQFLEAAHLCGFPKADPGTSHFSEGVAAYKITTLRGCRHSSSDAFLRPAMDRKNLEIRTGVLVERVGFSDQRATSVTYRRANQTKTVEVSRAVILAAGAVGSPSILQRSGVGPGALLSEHGIAPVHENPAVGGGLQDHLGIDYFFRASRPTLNQVLGTRRGQISAALWFLFKRRGALSLSINQMGGLVRHDTASNRADLQLYFNPLSYTSMERGKRVLLRPDPWPGFAIGFNSCRPTSVGRVDIQSADASAPPKISPNYNSTDEDAMTAIAGGRLVARMLETGPLNSLIAGQNGFSPVAASDEEILADFRARASTVFHACGTCRMAPEANRGVVDKDLKVHGVDGLRVVDASVFPNITSANTNAPTIMVAAKASELIEGHG